MRLFALPIFSLFVLVTKPCLTYPSSWLEGRLRTRSIAAEPTGSSPAALTNETITKVNELWAQLEVSSPVQVTSISAVVDAPAYIDVGPDPQKSLSFVAHAKTSGKVDHLHFPKHFIVGVTSAATPTEGAVKDDHRGPSVWDAMAHISSEQQNGTAYIQGSQPGFDIGVNFRYMYPLDIARVKAMGVRHYSFSVSWSRVFPMGYGQVSPEGLKFYTDLAQEIQRQGLEPVVTLFYWDVPLQIQLHYGGFASEKVIADYVHYAETIFKALAPHGVKRWFTFNSPQVFCLERYPALARDLGVEYDPALPWQCAGHILKAHGRTWETFQNLRSTGILDKHATLSYQNNGEKAIAYRVGSHVDKDALQRAENFYFALFAEPIFKTGDYPKEVRREVPPAWLPTLTNEDKKRIRGSADFMATNYYSSNIFKATDRQGGYSECVGNASHVAWPSCVDHCDTLADGQIVGERGDASLAHYMVNTAGSLRGHLRWLYDEYPSRGGIYITEWGWAESGEAGLTDVNDIRHDVGRQRYLRDHLSEMLLAIYKDGVPLQGAFVWSATDNVHWELGNTPRFGLQSIDFLSPNMTRTYLGSFFALREYFNKHG